MSWGGLAETGCNARLSDGPLDESDGSVYVAALQSSDRVFKFCPALETGG